MADTNPIEGLLKSSDDLRSIYSQINTKIQSIHSVARGWADVQNEILRRSQTQRSVESQLSEKTEEMTKLQAEINNLEASTVGYALKIQAAAIQLVAATKEREALLTRVINKQLLLASATKAGFGEMVSGIKYIATLWKTNPILLFPDILLKVLTIFSDLDSKAAEFRRNTGLTRDETKGIDKNARDIAFSLAQVGVSIDKAYNAAASMQKALGTAQYASGGMMRDMALLEASLGVATDTSAEFAKTMGMMGRSTMEAQQHIMMFTAGLAKAGGVNTNEVMSDIAQASKQAYSYLTKAPLELAKAAVHAKRLGTSLQDAAKTSSSIIQFSKSINLEMEASVLLGKGLNLQRARELAYRRDLKGLNVEILKLARESNFEQLDPFQQEAVAAAMGKSADEIGKMLQAERQLSKIQAAAASDPNTAKQLKAFQDMEKATEATAKAQAESISHQLAIRSNQAAITAVSQAWGAIVMRIGEVFMPKIEWILTNIAALMAKINDAVGTGWGAIATYTLGFVALGAAVWGVAKGIGWLMGKVGGAGGGFISKFFSGLSSGLKSLAAVPWSAVGKGIVILLGLGASLVVFAFALKMLQGITWETLGIAAVALLGLTAALLGLGALFSSPLAGLMIMGIAGLIGMSVGLGIFGVALKIVAEASDMLGKGMKSAAEGLKEMQNISLWATIKQVWELSNAIHDLNDVMGSLPRINIEALRGLELATTPVPVAPVRPPWVDEIGLIKTEISLLRQDLARGGISATVTVDGQLLTSTLDRQTQFRNGYGTNNAKLATT